VCKGIDRDVDYQVRCVTGDILRTQVLSCIQFQLGRRTYHHNFIVAAFSMKRDGLIGLDILRHLGAKIDFTTNLILIGEESFLVADVKECATSQGDVCKVSEEGLESGERQPEIQVNSSEIATPPPGGGGSSLEHLTCPILTFKTDGRWSPSDFRWKTDRTCLKS
jgi:hypothetical protein